MSSLNSFPFGLLVGAGLTALTVSVCGYIKANLRYLRAKMAAADALNSPSDVIDDLTF